MAHWESVVVALLCGLPQGAFAMLASLLGVVLPDCGFSEARPRKPGGEWPHLYLISDMKRGACNP